MPDALKLWALTVHQPWAGAIALGYKRIENRGWVPPKYIIGQHLAIHAGKRPMDEAAVDEVIEKGGIRDQKRRFIGDLVKDFGKIVAVAKVVGTVTPKTLEHDQRRWFHGDGEDDDESFDFGHLGLTSRMATSARTSAGCSPRFES